jgi:hypothetical protein
MPRAGLEGGAEEVLAQRIKKTFSIFYTGTLGEGRATSKHNKIRIKSQQDKKLGFLYYTESWDVTFMSAFSILITMY